MLNILKCIEAIDQEKTNIRWSENLVPRWDKFRYHKNPWQNGCFNKVHAKDKYDKLQYFTLDKPCKIAIDAISSGIVCRAIA